MRIDVYVKYIDRYLKENLVSVVNLRQKHCLPSGRILSQNNRSLLLKKLNFPCASLRGGVMSLVKGCLGGGIMCIHESYMVCGLWTALLFNAFLGFVLTYAMYVSYFVIIILIAFI